MAFVIAGSVPWHSGELHMHKLMRVPPDENPSAPYLSPGAAFLLRKSPLVALGTLDAQGRPWTSLWGGEVGFAGALASQTDIVLRSMVDTRYDPVVKALFREKTNGEIVKEERGEGRLMAGLPIDLESRRRVKLMGRMMAGSIGASPSSSSGGAGGGGGGKTSPDVGMAELVIRIESSLGNCPKYINRKHIVPALPEPRLVSDSPQLPQGAVELLNKADSLFLSTVHENSSMDTNIRGGSAGFVRLVSNEPNGAVIAYPEYSGNRLYQTLGNMQTTPLAGYVFPDFDTGNVLYLTGQTEVLVGDDAAALLPRSNLVIRVRVSAARYVEQGLSFRGISKEASPYNPPVRYLGTERNIPTAQGPVRTSSTTATLIKKDVITPYINRFRFKISDPAIFGRSTPGQYAILSFKDELDMGYSHMRDDDPLSINDDYIRTFTISSHPSGPLPNNEFEITVRKVGTATSHLFWSSERSWLELSLLGFGGEFNIKPDDDDDDDDDGGQHGITPFIAGGIGITPLLAQLPDIDIPRLRLFWSIRVQDIGFVHDVFQKFPKLPKSTTLFLTGSEDSRLFSPEEQNTMDAIISSGSSVHRRRMQAGDLDVDAAEVWYLCASRALKAMVLNWLVGKKVIYEDFSY
ncbi:hypothetical protein AJ80_04832 [Polytolypa hystricis UAMH7299]|uniref:FAD-binding FR-type domain-containing protein n=1 Tax=Polytolypa hystricis (strain UAMH7299) TaxID=1447883 RepID=A0A2B7Y9V3_POLH7|nr:hypothetical protein AJ80_04832 [Polytolypa hystricis UAMH7299]